MYIALFQKVLITKNFYFWITWGLLQLYSIPSLFQFSSIVLLLSTSIYDSAYFFFCQSMLWKEKQSLFKLKVSTIFLLFMYSSRLDRNMRLDTVAGLMDCSSSMKS